MTARRSALGRDLLISTSGTFVARAAAALGGVLVARLLGASLRGDYALVAFGAGLAGTAGTLGYEYWVTAATARRADPSMVRSVIVRQSIRAGVTLVIAGVLAGAAFERWHPRLNLFVGAAAGAFAAANVVAMLRLAALGGQRQMGRVAVAQIAAAGTYAGLVGVLLLVDKPSVALVTGAAMVSTATLAAAATTRARTGAGRSAGDVMRSPWQVGMPAMLGELATLLAYRLDLALIGILMTAGDVGRYAVAASLAELLWIIPNGASQVLLPQVAEHEQGDATGPVVALTTVMGIVGAVAISLAGSAVVPRLFGQQFAAATDALPWLCAAAVVLGGWKLLLADLAARGDTAVRATTAVAGTVAMVAADLLLIPVWGIGGAGAGSLLGYSIAFALTARRWSARSGSSPLELVDMPRAMSLLRSSLGRLGKSGAPVEAPLDKAPGGRNELTAEPGPRPW